MIRIGVDFGGAKIEAAALDGDGRFQARVLGGGGPGSVSPARGVMRNANSTHLNGRPFPEDLPGVLQRPIRCANDADCLALSEATDGAGAGAEVVFGAIVPGGGTSNVDELYARLPEAIGRHVFSDCFMTPVRKALHGDSSGVRGAAWLWLAEDGPG